MDRVDRKRQPGNGLRERADLRLVRQIDVAVRIVAVQLDQPHPGRRQLPQKLRHGLRQGVECWYDDLSHWYDSSPLAISGS